jgi:hypothetical protein
MLLVFILLNKYPLEWWLRFRKIYDRTHHPKTILNRTNVVSWMTILSLFQLASSHDRHIGIHNGRELKRMKGVFSDFIENQRARCLKCYRFLLRVASGYNVDQDTDYTDRFSSAPPSKCRDKTSSRPRRFPSISLAVQYSLSWKIQSHCIDHK